MKRALITGMHGQDGSYLAELLLGSGYEVSGLVRWGSENSSNWRLELLGIANDVRFIEANLTDLAGIRKIVKALQPDEVYNLASKSSVGESWRNPVETGIVTGLGAVNLLDAVRLECPQARVFQASSGEIFGRSGTLTQSEQTPYRPRSPYATAKLFAHLTVENFRDGLGMHCSSGILFNHESRLRERGFVSRKITEGAARIKLGLDRKLLLGNLDAVRDWGHARDYMSAAWLMLQQDRPDDYVIATGRATSVAEFCRLAFDYVGLDPNDHVEIDKELLRPIDVDRLVGDAGKARRVLGWSPEIALEGIIGEMIDEDLRELSSSKSVLRVRP